MTPRPPISTRTNTLFPSTPSFRSTAIKSGVTQTTPSPFGALRHVRACLLDGAYAEPGPADGPVVILLHGWPYDIHSYDEVAPLLAAKGYRVLIDRKSTRLNSSH